MMKDRLEPKAAQMIQEDDEGTFEARRARLQFVLDNSKDDVDYFTSGLAANYRDEAMLCWVTGAFAAAVVMTRLAFEALLATPYRLNKKHEDDRAKLTNTSFFNIIEEAENDGWITKEDALALHELREANISCVQVHDPVTDIKFFNQGRGIKEYGEGVADIAKKSIVLLLTLFPQLSRKIW